MASPSTSRNTPIHGRGVSQSGTKPHVTSGRAGAAPRHDRSVSKENMPMPGERTKALNAEHATSSEKRTERSQTTTREKVRVTKRPVRETVSAANRGDWEKTRVKKPAQNDGSPTVKPKEKEIPEGQPG